MRWNPRRRSSRLAIASLAGLLGVATFTVSTSAGAAAPNRVAAAMPTADDDWSMFMANIRHTGRSSSDAISSENVASLGLKWMSNTGQPSYTSPVVVYSEALGKQLLLAGSRNGTMAAYDTTNGERVWYFRAGAGISSTPAVFKNVVYWGAGDYKLRAFDLATGNLLCDFAPGGAVTASPSVLNVPGMGTMVYVGDAGIGGSADGGHIWGIRGVDASDGAANDCTPAWGYDQFGAPPGSVDIAGSWSPPGIGTDRNGRLLVVVGSSNPDNAIYALDARTGERVWRFQTFYDFQDADVGAGITVSNPGVNGFADGVAYGIGKYGIMYALNLTTGEEIWQFDTTTAVPGGGGGTRSTPALVGGTLIFGYAQGVFGVNAKTGAELWRANTDTKNPVLSSPAIAGPNGKQVAIVGSVEYPGRVYAFDVKTGAKLWSYRTGSFIWSSAAVSGNNVYIDSDDGFIYAFTVGASPSARPSTTITSPLAGAIVPNNGTLNITGTASDDVGVQKVMVAVRQINGNKWWDTTSKAKPFWNKVFSQSPATLAKPGRKNTTWTFDVPIPDSGGPYVIQAAAVDGDQQYTAPVALENIQVENAAGAPETTVTEPVRKQVYNFGPVPAKFPITVTGTATDPSGTKRGIKSVKVAIRNIEHGEYYCGGLCPGLGEDEFWSATYKVLDATLANPGANSTDWTITFPTYDHEHNYRVTAWAVDQDGIADASKANVAPICVRMAGDRTCN